MTTKNKYKSKTPALLPSKAAPQNWRLGPVVERMKENEEWDEIIDLLEPRLARHGSDHWLHVQLSIAYRNLDMTEGSDTKSAEHLNLARQHGPNCPWVKMEYAKQALKLGKYKEAIDNLKSLLGESILDIMGDSCFADIRHARQLRHEAQAKALALLKKANRKDPVALFMKYPLLEPKNDGITFLFLASRKRKS